MDGILEEMNQTNFEINLKRGRTAEESIANTLMNMGYYVIPSYEYTGDEGNKAPKLWGIKDSFVVPDLDVAKNKVRIWVEVKLKAKANYTRITKQLEHGIPYRNYLSYLKIQEITGCIVFLYVFEENTLSILYHQLDKLPKRLYTGNKMDRGGTIFFPRHCFNLLGFLVGGRIFNTSEINALSSFVQQINDNLPETKNRIFLAYGIDCSFSEIYKLRNLQEIFKEFPII